MYAILRWEGMREGGAGRDVIREGSKERDRGRNWEGETGLIGAGKEGGVGEERERKGTEMEMLGGRELGR